MIREQARFDAPIALCGKPIYVGDRVATASYKSYGHFGAGVLELRTVLKVTPKNVYLTSTKNAALMTPTSPQKMVVVGRADGSEGPAGG
jgi:hypothetical protein